MESGKIIVVANQKGGVAKTSTVRNLSYALAEMGKKVLVVDFDPQYNLTTSFGVLPTQTPCNTGTLITNLLLDESLPDTNEFIQKIGSVDLIPSSRSLTVAEANLLMTPDSNDYLAALLNPLRLSYDYIIVDTNPSLGSLTINALTAADEVIIPIDPELFALTGLQALVDTIKKIKRKLNPSIEIGGILFTKCNKRTNLYVKDIRGNFLYTRDNLALAYLKIYPISTELFSKNEKRLIAKQLTVSLSSAQYPFQLLAVSRPVDISPLLSELSATLTSSSDVKQKELLKQEIVEMGAFALSGEVVERQFYIKIWDRVSDGVERDLLQKLKLLGGYFSDSGIQTEILEQQDIVRLCNLVNNPAYVHLEDSGINAAIPILESVGVA